MPGLYEYRRPGDDRVEYDACRITLNYGEDNASEIPLPYGQTFTINFYTYHGQLLFYDNSYPGCGGRLYRIGD